jgi:succinate dehydrogenase / fumarate reductase cytochrome b subunit
MQSSIGQKLVMAATGVILSLFVLGHMTGNLLAFQGPGPIRKYAEGLRMFPALLWAVRLGLLAAVGLHIWSYWVLSRKSWAARPSGYRVTVYEESSWASRTMRWTGPILLAFIIYHLLHMTLGLKALHPDFDHNYNVYHNLVTGLSVAWVGAFYIVAALALGFHLWHGIWSTFQTIGISQPRYESLARRLATIFTIVVVGGFVAVPLAILTGFLR